MASVTERAALAVALLPCAPEGMIVTRTAGVVQVHATFSWRSACEMPDTAVLPEPFELSRVRIQAAEEADAEGAGRSLVAEVRALSERDLGATVERVLRAATEYAARSEAIFEARTVRVADPQVTPAGVLEALARDLWAAGFRVSFGPCWSPAPEAAAYVGCGGAGSWLADSVRSCPSWRVI